MSVNPTANPTYVLSQFEFGPEYHSDHDKFSAQALMTYNLLQRKKISLEDINLSIKNLNIDLACYKNRINEELLNGKDCGSFSKTSEENSEYDPTKDLKAFKKLIWIFEISDFSQLQDLQVRLVREMQMKNSQLSTL